MKTTFALTLTATLLCSTSYAYLGGFEDADGYSYGSPMGFNLGDNDVTRYNAGQYGTNNGGPGGSAALITPDTGLWRVITGGRLLNQANDYYVIRHSAPSGHTSANVLGLTTGNSAFVGVDTEYQYDFDARDFDGNAPSSLGSSVVDMEFYWCPQNGGLGGTVSTLSNPGATIQLQDSAGNNYFEIGSYGPGEAISYRIAGGTWIAAGFNASSAFHDFDRINLRFDLLNDTVSFSFYETAATTNHVVLTNASLGSNMDYLGHMGLTMQAENTKNFLDDVDFRVRVPEPAAGMLATLAIGLVAPRRREAKR